MKLITKVEIEGFRSISGSVAQIDGDFVTFVGVNNCGKSNFLRALSLFFTGRPEPSSQLNLIDDCFSDPRSKKKKEIIIAVSFKLPPNFRFRKGLEEVKALLGDEFTIRQKWSYYPVGPIVEYQKPGFEYVRMAPYSFDQFRDLINFRYIQNRVVPTQVLREEGQAFQAAIGRLLRLRGFEADELLKQLGSAASDILSEADDAMRTSTKSINKLEIYTPSEVAALAAFSGLRVETKTGAKISDYLLGAGSQAFMMFALLKIIDTDYSRHFGWKQSTIWAVEEPESSLHQDLEQRLAIILREWAEKLDLRLQIFTTTHSETFVTASSQGLLVEITQGKTEIHNMEIPELVNKASIMGISGIIEPVLCFPTSPVVLVEGQIDQKVLSHVSQISGVASKCRFVTLPGLDPVQIGSGVDSIILYLKRYGRLIHNRAQISPFIVLFDWDIPELKLSDARQHYGPNSGFRVIRLDQSYTNAKVASSMKGIERFYPPELFLTARDKDLVDISLDQNGCISIQDDKFKASKWPLSQLFCSSKDPIWIEPIVRVLKDIEKSSLIMPGGQPKLAR